jgi:hypothetical protein
MIYIWLQLPFHGSLVQNQQVLPQFPAQAAHAQQNTALAYTLWASHQPEEGFVSTGPKFIPLLVPLLAPPLAQIHTIPDDERGPATSTSTAGKDKGPNSEKNKHSSKKSSGKAKEKLTEKARGGRQQGASNFGEAATVELLRIVERKLPIGGGGWEAVKNEYNTYVQENDLLE